MSGGGVLVVGFGVTGRAVVRRLAAEGQRAVVVDDTPTPEAVAGAEAAGVELVLTPQGDALAQLVGSVESVVVSPGVPPGHPVVEVANRLRVPVTGEVELAARVLAERGAAAPALVAITGTNGKTTVTTQVSACLTDSGRSAVAAGNIGRPLVEVVANREWDVVVAEVSSFQLQLTSSLHPQVSCWLNLAPDHLDWHPTLEHYAAAKARIWAHQGAGDTAVVNADDPAVMAASERIPAGVRVVTFSTQGEADFDLDDGCLRAGGEFLMEVAELPRRYPHDVANALAAAAVALHAGASEAGCREALRTTKPLPHRIALVAQRGGVGWYDDSKATTPASVLAAVAGFPSVVLIAGGRNKGLDLGVLRQTVPPVRAVVAVGEASAEVRSAFEGAAEVQVAASMEEAVVLAGAMAAPGDAVVLSPGCASFDWYGSYAERGDDFAAAVRRHLRGEEGRADPAR